MKTLESVALAALLLLLNSANGDDVVDDDEHADAKNLLLEDDVINDDDNLTYEQALVTAYLPKPFFLLSIISSYVVIRELVVDHREKKGGPIARMLISRAAADICTCVPSILGTWPAPRDTTAITIVGNVGNQATCTLQGFVTLLGYTASILTTASLSILFLQVVRYGKRDQDMVRLEWLLQVVSWSGALGCAIYPVPLQMYNAIEDRCSLESSPPQCDTDDCIRGSSPRLLQLVFMIMPFAFLFCAILPITAFLVIHIRQLENKIAKYTTSTSRSLNNTSTNNNNNNNNNNMNGTEERRSILAALSWHRVSIINRKKSNAVAVQGIMYASAFIFSYALPLVALIVYIVTEHWNDWLATSAYLVLRPLAGFYNLVIFVRVRNMKTREGTCLKSILCRCCCPCRKRGICHCCCYPCRQGRMCNHRRPPEREVQPPHESHPIAGEGGGGGGPIDQSEDGFYKDLYDDSVRSFPKPESATSNSPSTSSIVPHPMCLPSFSSRDDSHS